jgi:hypothetical protein
MYGGPTLGTSAGLLGLAATIGFRGISGEIGLLAHPGIQDEKISAYMESSRSVSTTSWNLGLSYSYFYPRWHICWGGGITFMMSREDSDDSDSSSSQSRQSTRAYVPNIQTVFSFRLMSIIYLRVGYRLDFYPKDYRDFFYKDTRTPDGTFLGHSLMFGILMTTARMRSLAQ